MPAPKITVRFIRKDEKHSSNDDIVNIRRVGTNQYKLAYTYGQAKKTTTQSLTLNDDEVFRWMRCTIGLVEKDAEPFESIQLDLPYMPSVVFSVSNLDSVYHRVLDALNFHLNNWPAPVEDEYADLPPLEPIDLPLPSPTNGRHIFFD